ncbi:MAG: metalloregulator ArsR/SmtB family transcription factor [Thermomicrobiales bacterium]|nr:metalloregulator ArsR/SmtB family transcription factor [Thermomicrobiales bacterium]MCO5223976.1 metalloregulator ArsR/SmtB family transcription factor [Thermomicrobiales bacterium]MCO5226790.1 metalloregulator ArsR/SmtB family transcription factor [Thermomicrobiales bacterium]
MGELVVGRPALQVRTALSVPLDLMSMMSLLYRAVPGSGLDPWLIGVRRALSWDLQEDLDLLHGFSGRLLYYMEEPVMAFQPLSEERANATIEDLLDFLDGLTPEHFRTLAIRAIDRAHRDLGTELAAPSGDDENEWRRYLEPVLTTADANDVLAMMLDPELLKQRTIRLISGIWNEFYREEYESRQETLREAETAARSSASKGFGMAFAELTGNRLPATLTAALNMASSVTFIPSGHLGDFVSYISYPPELVIFFSAQHMTGNQLKHAEHQVNGEILPDEFVASGQPMPTTELMESLRALSDGNRMRIIDLLSTGELYAQEIVGRLGIAQSAVSRHLSQLERAGIVRVEPRRGLKYYVLDRQQMRSIAEGILFRVQ